ncbi:MAG: hypothetical protein ABEJ65_04900, partial [bacterium]
RGYWELVQRNRNDLREILVEMALERFSNDYVLVSQPSKNRTARQCYGRFDTFHQISQELAVFDENSKSLSWINTRDTERLNRSDKTTQVGKRINFMLKPEIT